MISILGRIDLPTIVVCSIPLLLGMLNNIYLSLEVYTLVAIKNLNIFGPISFLFATTAYGVILEFIFNPLEPGSVDLPERLMLPFIVTHRKQFY